MADTDSHSGKRKTNSNLAWHRPQSEGCRLEQELILNSTTALASTTDLVERLRLLCLAKGAGGILTLGRYFREVSPKMQLTKEEFKAAMKRTGLGFGDHETKELFALLDKDRNGVVSVEHFIEKIRPPMSDSRQSIVEQAFRKLDKHGHGSVSVQEIRDVYSMTSKSSFTCGDETAEIILARFLAHFETEGMETVDEKVNLEEFMNYYSVISVSVEEDGNFDLMMRQIYQI